MKIIKTAFSLLSALICHIQGYAQTDSAYARILLQNTGHEFVYSENNNLISRKSREYNSFFCYDKRHRNTKEVNIMIGKTWDVHTKKYDKNGYITHFSYENPVSKDSGSTKFKYDKFNNKIYEASGPDVKINPYEYFYEIEYY